MLITNMDGTTFFILPYKSFFKRQLLYVSGLKSCQLTARSVIF